jgi:hypothetical protein
MKLRLLKFSQLLVLCFIIMHPDVFAQRSIRKNPHVEYNVQKKGDIYDISYTFLDPFDHLETFSIQLPIAQTNHMIEIFGIPASMFEPFAPTHQVLSARKQILEKGLFLLNNKTIEVDKSAVVEVYSESFCRPVAEFIVESLIKSGSDSRKNRIEFAMCFVQDIPYGIPKYDDKTRHFGGVFPPAKILIEGYGDCDSKAILFAGILTYLIDPEDFIFLNQSNHVLSAIRAAPSQGMTFVRYEGDTYLVAETAGPGRRKLGEKGQYFQTRHMVEPLKVKNRYTIPVESTNTTSNSKIDLSNTTGSSIAFTNTSDRTLRISLSTGNSKWKQITIAPNHTTKIVFEKDENVMIRFREDSSNLVTRRVDTGKSYSFSYSQRKGKWNMFPS